MKLTKEDQLAYAEFSKELKLLAKQGKKNTVRAYRLAADRCFYHGYHVEMTIEEFHDFFDTLRHKYQPKTVELTLRIAKKIQLAFWKATGRGYDHPIFDFRYTTARPQPAPLLREEINKLRQELNSRDWNLVLFMMSTGLRIAEVDTAIIYKEGFVKVRGIKREDDRLVPILLPKKERERLIQALGSFSSKDVIRAFRHAKQVGVQVNQYRTRATFATRTIELGIDEVTASRFMGHKTSWAISNYVKATEPGKVLQMIDNRHKIQRGRKNKEEVVSHGQSNS